MVDLFMTSNLEFGQPYARQGLLACELTLLGDFAQEHRLRRAAQLIDSAED